jgi:hypothetical protein
MTMRSSVLNRSFTALATAASFTAVTSFGSFANVSSGRSKNTSSDSAPKVPPPVPNLEGSARTVPSRSRAISAAVGRLVVMSFISFITSRNALAVTSVRTDEPTVMVEPERA